MMLERMLGRLISKGRLTVIEPGEKSYAVGDGNGPPVIVRIHDAVTAWRLALNPDLYLGEAYMDGSLTFEEGSIWDLLEIYGRNVSPHQCTSLLEKAGPALTALDRFVKRVRRDGVAQHYDLSPELYQAFLDEDLQYSCAYFTEGVASIDTAQRAKKAHIIAKLDLKPNQRVLDIGCGWGGLAFSIAETEHVDVLGVTLSAEQLRVCRARAEELGLADRVRFELRDYREVHGTFDRIVSIGMFEHVGVANYPAFFACVKNLLADRGVALIHAIGRAWGPSYTSAWLDRYIFPGGYAPALSEVIPHIENAGLWLTDLEVLRLHYARTLRLWRERFYKALERGLDIEGRFARMWEYYLAACELSFRYCGFMIFQAQIAASVDALPITRTYMNEREDEVFTALDRPAARRASERVDSMV